VDQTKYRRIFVDEARENLSSFSNQLVVFEKLSATNDAANRQHALDAVFRAAHSIKGMAAALGLDVITHLSHTLEDLADVGRRQKSLSRVALDLLLEGGERLEAMVTLVERGEDAKIDPGDLPARVERATLAEDPARRGETPSPVERPAEGSSGSDVPLRHVHVAGTTVVVHMDPDEALPHVRAFMVHRALSARDGYVRTDPAPDLIRQGQIPDHTLRFTFREGTVLGDIVVAARAERGVKDAVIDAPTSDVKSAPDAVERRPDADRTVRIRTALLDEFIDSVGELLLARSRLRALASRHPVPELDDLAGEIERLTRDLHDRVIAARMTPIAFLTERFPPLVRSLARKLEKSVSFHVDGAEIELDRAILDELATPLIHMLRNAVDHAHEGDDARRARQKPVSMTLRLRASRDRDSVLLELKDDGRGIDPQFVRMRAIERGLIEAHKVADMSDAEAIELICAPGFTTMTEVSETSGRGVGMDVVKATLERLGGSLKIRSEVGRGTTFSLRLPLTVAIIQVLVVEAGPGDVFAVPVARVDRALDIEPSHVQHANGLSHILLGDELLPLFDLAHELGFRDHVETQKRGRHDTAIVLGTSPDRMAFSVGAVIGQEEVVVKPLGAPLSAFDYLAGAALLADGRTAYIIEPTRLPRAV
jgi:two-component system chemotaxis sensor kinase CheA